MEILLKLACDSQLYQDFFIANGEIVVRHIIKEIASNNIKASTYRLRGQFLVQKQKCLKVSTLVDRRDYKNSANITLPEP